MSDSKTDPVTGPATVPAKLLALVHRRPFVAGGIAAVVVVAIVLAVLAFRPDPDDGTGPTAAQETRAAPKSARPGQAEQQGPTPEPTTSATPADAAELAPPAEYSDRPRGNDSTAEARLVGVDAGKGRGSETVTFSFDGKGKLPKYHVEYTDVVRLYPDEEPIPVNGNAYLVVSFELTDPNQAGKLSFPPSIQAGQPQIQEVLLYDNLARSLKFAIGLERKTRFRVLTPKDPSRLVVEIQR
ncbi:AMIN-like domain-containing (lipo)protein [Flindersiella endophytica]